MDDLDKRGFRAACKLVIAEPKNPGFMAYGKTYAKAGLELDGSQEIKVQCLYILNNISHWRGKDAKAAREIFKRLSR